MIQNYSITSACLDALSAHFQLIIQLLLKCSCHKSKDGGNIFPGNTIYTRVLLCGEELPPMVRHVGPIFVREYWRGSSRIE